MDLWSSTLDLVSQIVTPLWATLLQYIPLLFVGLLLLTLLGLARAWHRNAAHNASRVPRPLPAGPVPSGVHMPSGSLWPFVAPIGLVLIFFSLAVGGGEGVFLNIPIAVTGVLIGVIGAAGWYRDANREYEQIDAHDHGLRLAAETHSTPAPVVIPEGIHMPGPSPWPFLAPIGLFFVFLGLVLGPLLIVAGAVMAVAAAAGWYLDANREFVQVEAGHEAEPVTRDPVKVFPHKLVPVFAGVAVFAILLTLGPWLLTFLPQQAAAGDQGPPATTTPYLSASAATHFDQGQIVDPGQHPGDADVRQQAGRRPPQRPCGGPRNEGLIRVRGRGRHRRRDHRVSAAAPASWHVYLRLHHPPADDRDARRQGGTAADILSDIGRRRAVIVAAAAVTVVVLAAVLFVPLGGAAPSPSPGGSGPIFVGGSPLLGKPAPAIALNDLDGKAVTLADLAGRPVVVNIWASWCVPCRGEFPLLVGAYGEYRDRGLEILGVVHDDSAPNARAFAQQQGATWPMLLDDADTVWHDYIGLGVPQSYFIDADGIVRAFSLGPFSTAGLAADLATILPPAASPGGS